MSCHSRRFDDLYLPFFNCFFIELTIFVESNSVSITFFALCLLFCLVPMLTAGTDIYASLIELDEFPITQEHLFKSVEYKSDGMFQKSAVF